MKLQHEHKVVSSFLLFLEHELGKRGNAYTNHTSDFYPINNKYLARTFQTVTTPPPTDCPDCIVISNWAGPPTGWADAFERNWEMYKSDGVPELWNGKPVWAADWSTLSYGDNQGVLWYTPASQGLITGGGWCITATLGSQDDIRPRAFAASGNEECPIDATWPTTTFGTMESCDAVAAPETIETTAAYYAYAAPFDQFVFDDSIKYSKDGKTRGPQIPSGIYVGDEYLTPGTGSLMSIDYTKGQLYFSSDYPSQKNTLPRASYAVKDFNIYLTNEPEHKLLFETQFKVAPKVSQSPTGLAEDIQTYPALYVKNLDSNNELVSLGSRVADTNTYIRVIALCDSAYLLDAVCSLMKDFGRRKMPILEGAEQPFGPLGYTGQEPFSYENTVSGKFESEDNHLLIHDVNISKRSQNQTDFKNLNSEVFVGFIDFTLKNLRNLD